MSGSPTEDLATRVRALGDLSVPALRRCFEETLGRPTRSDNRAYLTGKIVQALCERDPPRGRNAKRNLARAIHAALAPRSRARPRPLDPRIPPPGSVLRRTHAGRMVEVHVTKAGFRWEGREYASLSAIACEATGQRWNGILWFGLRPRQRGAPAVGSQP
jgi:hypothetical protein